MGNGFLTGAIVTVAIYVIIMCAMIAISGTFDKTDVGLAAIMALGPSMLVTNRLTFGKWV